MNCSFKEKTMNATHERNTRILTGILLIAAPVILFVAWTLLMITFEYPDILRQPVGKVLQKYSEGGISLKWMWGEMALSTGLLIPIALLLHGRFTTGRDSLLTVGTVFGILAGFCNIVGFSRWLFFVDSLAREYVLPGTSALKREILEVSFTSANTFLGVTIGEVLGYIFLGLWLLSTGYHIIRTKAFPAWTGVLSILCGLGALTGILEWAQVSWAGIVNQFALMGYLAVMIAMGIILFTRRKTGVE